MKKLVCILTFALFSVTAFAGVGRFSVRHVVKPAVKVSAKAVKASAKGAKKAAKAGVKVAY